MPDYFPLVKGAVRGYVIDGARPGSFTIEIIDVVLAGEVMTAKCRRTLKRPGEPSRIDEFIVTKNAEGVRSGPDVEFNFPAAVGTEWISPPRRFWIEALDAAVETPAGRFTGCLRVAYLIAEGDGGSGERCYAPGVGLVKVVENDEAEPFTWSLLKKSR
jgi:hypothetical protein